MGESVKHRQMLFGGPRMLQNPSLSQGVFLGYKIKMSEFHVWTLLEHRLPREGEENRLQSHADQTDVNRKTPCLSWTSISRLCLSSKRVWDLCFSGSLSDHLSRKSVPHKHLRSKPQSLPERAVVRAELNNKVKDLVLRQLNMCHILPTITSSILSHLNSL